MADRVGQQLDNYHLIHLLGMGGFGEVYLGEHIYHKTQVAIKVLPQLAADDLQSFLTEARTVRLKHPNIVQVLDFGVEGHTPFIVMEYAPKGTLRQRHPKGTRVSLPTIVSYIKQVASALQYAHDERLIHRDVKPENMLIGALNQVLLSDFGIATIAHGTSSQSVETMAGTIPYMAPEQVQGHPRLASDQYSLGVVVYEWLCGDRPFHGTLTEVAVQHTMVPPPPLREKVPTISPDVEQVVLKALAKGPHQRFASVKIFADALEQAYLSVQSPLPVPPTTLPPSRDPSVSSNPVATSPTIRVQQNSHATQHANSSLTQQTHPYQSVTSPALANANQPMQIQQQPSPVSQPLSLQSSPFAPAAPRGPQIQQPPRSPSGNNVGRILILFIIAILLIFGVIAYTFSHFGNPGSGTTSTPGATTTTVSSLPNGIGVTKAPDGEYIGISDGAFAFDTNRPDGRFKTQAADKLKARDVGGAESLWQSGLAADTNDAEALIYLEDQQVLASGNPYVTFVVGTMLTGDNVGVGRDDLQGAYIAQKEYNDGHKLPNNVEVRLLIANSGNVATYANAVAQQIVQAVQQDHTIVGVMGWPFSSRTVNAVGVLAKAHIPMVSQSASSDQITGISPYFFRVVPSNKGQAIAGAQYAEQVLHAHNVALFVDPADSYSSSLAADFSQKFLADGNYIVVTEKYTVGSQGQGKLSALLQDALSHNPDLIYFSGYSTDISVLLTNLPASGPYASLQILGGDAFYELGGYSSSARANFTRLHFTAFAYPDEWGNGGIGGQKPAFFNEYIAAYNPNGQQPGGKYGYTTPSSDVMLSYDATLALLTGSKVALSAGKTSITPADMQQGLKQITGAQALQGVTGPIAFGSNGDPIGKPFVVLAVDALGRIHEERLQGCLLVGSCS